MSRMEAPATRARTAFADRKGISDVLRGVRLGQFVRFAAVGIAATAMHFAVLLGAVELVGLPPALANGLAFLVAGFMTYLGQSLWVFDVTRHDAGQMARFLASAGGGLVANVGLMALLVQGFGVDYRLSFVFILVTVPLGTFFVNKFWVFGRDGGRYRTR